ncbi:hypothetical protein EON82_01240 [bacterium]|nr:MAG: hypothetical protein EON82_01240 [bacterium]
MSEEVSGELPPELVNEQDALIAEIYGAFDGVTREGGVSWAGSWDIDMYGQPESRIAAGIEDRDSEWSDLVNDPSWRPGAVSGAGPFSIQSASVTTCLRLWFDQ